MAKSDSHSNGLRQDQPECASQREAGGGNIAIVVQLGTPIVDRPSVTELPGLTSDSIYTAYRRGGILISFGPYCMPERGINPSNRHRGPCGRELRPDRTTIAFQPNALLYLRASDRTDVGPTVVGWSAVDISTGCVQLSPQFGGTGPRHVRVQTKGEGLFNSVEPSAPRHAVTTRRFVWKTNTGQDQMSSRRARFLRSLRSRSQ